MADDGEDFFFLLSLVLDDEAALVPSPLVDEAPELPPLIFLALMNLAQEVVGL